MLTQQTWPDFLQPTFSNIKKYTYLDHFKLKLKLSQKKIHIFLLEEWILEAKTECYGKDRLFVASFVCFVITFEPIMI